MARFEEGALAGLYRAEYLIGQIAVSNTDIETFAATCLAPGKELTDNLWRALVATIRKERFKERVATERARLRQDARVVIRHEALASPADATREDGVVVATIDDTPVTWGDVKEHVPGATSHASLAPMDLDAGAERLSALEGVIDARLMAMKARVLGLPSDPASQARVAEFRKTRLVNLHRERLLAQLDPNDAEIRAYDRAHRQEIAPPERRRIQMVVVKTREEAEAIRARIESGETSIHAAAAEHSIDPRATETLGEMGWVAKGTGFPELDELTFSLEPERLGGP